ncbi:MAG: LuxR C-terminal-related transcriptional regulator [Flectobacillus sp.]|nr:LuxR C-terminal-related transcriptional regulator [Flectobacillus sp.]
MFLSSLPPKLLVASNSEKNVQMFVTLRSEVMFEVIKVAEKYSDICLYLQQLRPDYLLVDSTMASSIGKPFFDLLLLHQITTKIIVSTRDTLVIKQLSFSSYFNGSILQEGISQCEFVMCLKSIFKGNKLVYAYRVNTPNVILSEGLNEEKLNFLSEREQEVWNLLLNANSEQEMADKLYISVQTVRKHKSNIADKLGIKHKKRLTRFAFEYARKIV